MKNYLQKTAIIICLAYMLLPFAKLQAQEADNKFTLNLNILERGELRYGEFREEDETKEGLSQFVLSRYRLTADYQRSWLEARVSLQQAGTWGMAGGSFSLNEAWAMVKSEKGLPLTPIFSLPLGKTKNSISFNS